MTRRHLTLLLRLAVGIALLVWVVRRVDFRQAANLSLSSLHPGWAMVALLLGGLSVLGWALRWHLYLRIHDLKPDLRETVRLTLFADFFNLYFLGPLGADGLRVLLLSRRFPGRKTAIASSILLDHVGGLFGGAILYALFTRTQTQWLIADGSIVSRAVLVTTDCVLGVFGFVTFAGLALINHRSIQKLITDKLGMPWMVKPLMPFMFLREHRMEMLAAQIVSVLTLLCNYGAFWSAGCAAGFIVPPQKLLAIMPMVDVVTSLPVTISGIGVRENLFVELLGRKFEFGAPGALAISLLGFAAIGVWGLIGGVWLAVHRFKTGLQIVPQESK